MNGILQALGGVRTVRPAPRDGHEWRERIMTGIPARAALIFKDKLGLTNDQLAALLGLSARSVNRLSPPGALLPPVAGDRLYRCARLYALAENVFEDAAAAVEWLKTPQRALDDTVPLDLAATDIGTREVETLLGRIEHSVYT